MSQCIERHEFDAAELCEAEPPRVTHRNKATLLELAYSKGPASGRLGFTRWSKSRPPPRLPETRARVHVRPGVFPYAESDASTLRWHMNFADKHLFGYYAGGLFAQDEIQVAEHPALASLRQRLTALGRPPVTVEQGSPTPALVTNVERRCAVDTRGIYGNSFGMASRERVIGATRVLHPPTRSNILAIEAPKLGRGLYTLGTLESALATAYSGQLALRQESARIAPAARTELVTGFWGCGAFGGNRVVMIALQIVAAHLAELDDLVFHTVDSGSAEAEEALALVEECFAPSSELDSGLDALLEREYEWGESDGN
jgi:hypothetical protein